METFAAKVGLKDEPFKVHNVFPGKVLLETKYTHPLYSRTSEVLAGGDYITTETGTGLVHTAPGHGQEDYLTVRNTLPYPTPFYKLYICVFLILILIFLLKLLGVEVQLTFVIASE